MGFRVERRGSGWGIAAPDGSGYLPHVVRVSLWDEATRRTVEQDVERLSYRTKGEAVEALGDYAWRLHREVGRWSQERGSGG